MTSVTVLFDILSDGSGPQVLGERDGVPFSFTPSDRWTEGRQALLQLQDEVGTLTPGFYPEAALDQDDFELTTLTDRSIRLLDLQEVVLPMLSALDPSTWLLHPGHGDLTVARGFDARRSLLAGVEAGLIPPAVLMRTGCLRLWSQAPVPLMVSLARNGALPALRGPEVQVAWCIPEHVFEGPSTWAGALVHARRILVRETEDAGARWASVQDGPELVELLRGGDEDQALLLVCHQDPGSEALVLPGGRLPVPALADGLRKAGPTYHTVILAVCHAERPGNLADTFQALGSLVVIPQGEYAHLPFTCVRMANVLRGCRSSALPAPLALDRAWLGSLRRAAARRTPDGP